ncbi:hypothetical protein OVS_04350 [Mycoplasma ovis str. Michigan]|uniref:Uncharacterized protein n=1 Tax=Mycoplasma ovis str. Michigan TaxID=1415773 RepID=A0ABM5P2K0_9MOLU|nr:hypothetical protein [Mycoplasma ovis]AHC40597.1 hypothetical protein OVS_04350 [Mycoplasma ovis str. Michigan]
MYYYLGGATVNAGTNSLFWLASKKEEIETALNPEKPVTVLVNSDNWKARSC